MAFSIHWDLDGKENKTTNVKSLLRLGKHRKWYPDIFKTYLPIACTQRATITSK